MTRVKCRMLRKRGHSIGHIARRLKLSKSTVHWHVRDIELTTLQRNRLRREKQHVMEQVNAKRRGRPLKPIAFLKPAWSQTLVHLIAHFSFDGRLDRYGCAYYNRMHSQIMHMQQLMQQLLEVQPKIRQRESGIWVLSYYNVELATWLLQKERELLSQVRRESDWQQEWLRAFFDDEGHVHMNGQGIRRVRASQDHPPILEFAKKCLASMGIGSRIDKHAKAIEITGREYLEIFSRKINFSDGIAVNEHRKNGLWKQPVQKRQLLSLALGSY